ncbi:MAG: polysaccharide deacetylase family protein [Chloroflexi bacterium]|nr:polysaccharide deacetylase family protein [Chloroflexota bacterium]
MPGMRKPGMDNDYYDFSPIVKRAALKWPDNARVALCVIVNLEHYEIQPPADAYMPPNLPGGLGRGGFPDFRSVSHRDYGNRVGIFRVMNVLDKHGIKGTAAIDATVAENYPFIVNECKKRGWEFIGHGQTVNRSITSNMTEAQEREYIRSSLDAVAKATGKRPGGWLGPEYGESTRTPAILAAEGVQYVCDWPNDEQPYRMKVPKGSMVSLPIMLELDDVFTHWNRRVTIMRWEQLVREAFDTMYVDGARGGRLLTLNLHPFLIGQPFRIKYLDQALEHIFKRGGVWKATGGEIVNWFLQQG